MLACAAGPRPPFARGKVVYDRGNTCEDYSTKVTVIDEHREAASDWRSFSPGPREVLLQDFARCTSKLDTLHVTRVSPHDCHIG